MAGQTCSWCRWYSAKRSCLTFNTKPTRFIAASCAGDWPGGGNRHDWPPPCRPWCSLLWRCRRCCQWHPCPGEYISPGCRPLEIEVVDIAFVEDGRLAQQDGAV